MATFKDSSGRDWIVSLDGPTILRVREDCEGLNLADQTGQSYERVAADPVLLFQMLWTICREQAEREGLNAAAFGKLITGDVIASAVGATLDAMLNFFPPQERKLLQAAAGRNARVKEAILAEVQQKIADPDLEKQEVAEAVTRINQSISSVLTPPSAATSSPESSESGPTD